MKNKETRKVVFLYTELADYITVCMDQLPSHGIETHVFHYPVNPEAPFKFDHSDSDVIYISKVGLGASEIINYIRKVDPDIIICSGWIDRDYLQVMRTAKEMQIKNVVAFDNPWEGDLTSYLKVLRARILYKPIFDYAWVPGFPQHKFAIKMGFQKSSIYKGFYTANFERFSSMRSAQNQSHFPKRFVYIGRYVEFKGIQDLWESFESLKNNEWVLDCAGEGPLFQNRSMTKGVRHRGFVQPRDLDTFVEAGGVFILPSHTEPWGVVVHEFASAGYPIICSDKVGARWSFVEDGVNGFTFPAGNKKALKSVLAHISKLSDLELIAMGEESRRLAGKIRVKTWVQTLEKMLTSI